MLIDRIFSDGESAEAHLLMGMAHVERDYRGALAELQKASPSTPTCRPCRRPTDGCARDGRPRRRRCVSSAVRWRRPEQLRGAQHWARSTAATAVSTTPMRYLKRAQALQPHDPRYVRHRGGAAGTGEVENARELLEGLVAEVPAYIEAHVLLATRYYRLKRKEDGDRERRSSRSSPPRPRRSSRSPRAQPRALRHRRPAFAGPAQELTCAGTSHGVALLAAWRIASVVSFAQSPPPNRRSQAPRHRPRQHLGPPAGCEGWRQAEHSAWVRPPS